MPFRFVRVVAVVCAALASLCMAPAHAEAASQAAVRAALEQWRQDFNARRAERICDLFALDLRADIQGLPEQNYPLVCERLRKALASPGEPIVLGLRIKEITVSGAMAVARVTWTSTVMGPHGQPQAEDEQGLDVFARQPDGSWKIVRYMAYAEQRE